MKNVTIITAGGKGKRIKGNVTKQFIKIAGRHLLFWTIDKFVENNLINEILLTLPKDEINLFKDKILEEYPNSNIYIISGGKKRQDSVFNALKSCPAGTDYVLIHDGVRPFISSEDITKLIEIVKEKKAVIPVSKTKNTIKKVVKNKIVRTIPRLDLVNAFTPQVFAYDLIYKYHKKAKAENLYFTDDAAILEHYGQKVYTLETTSLNFKITIILI